MATKDLNHWSERQRLCFIERLLFWRGYINRRDLIDFFGISAPQATNDLVNYTTRNPGGCQYNVRTKRYEASGDMEMVLLVPDFGRDVEAMESAIWLEEGVPFVLEPCRPPRVASIDILRQLSLAAHRRESVELRYWSANSGTAHWRRISPRAFGNDGLRWHVRAYCHRREDFRDFNVGRMKGLRENQPCTFLEKMDEDWVSSGTMVIRANPNLPENEKTGLEMDYGMRRGTLSFPVRRALLTYTARRLGFVDPQAWQRLPVLNESKQLEWVSWKP